MNSRPLFFLLLAANLALATLIALGGAPGGDTHVFQPLDAERIGLVDPAATAPSAAGTKAAACLEWGSFNPDELPQAQETLAKLELGGRLSVKEVQEPSGYWVYIAPFDNRQEANRKVAELKAMGIADYFVIQDAASRWKNAISLGMFRTEEGAIKHLADLNRKGVKEAVASRRDATVMRSVFVVRDPDDALTARLVELTQEFKETQLKATACEGSH